MIIWGIDPGREGGLARICGNHVLVFPMTDLSELIPLIAPDVEHCHVWLEQAQSMPKQGIASAFNYGAHFGELRGMLRALGVPFTEVRPRTWAKEIHAGTKGGVPKARTLEAVRRLFPKVQLVRPGCRVPHLGIVDALAIAEHGRRVLRA